MRSIVGHFLLTLYFLNDISNVEKGDDLKEKMEKQIVENRPYDEIYKTSVEIDELLVEYYNRYGINGKLNKEVNKK